MYPIGVQQKVAAFFQDFAGDGVSGLTVTVDIELPSGTVIADSSATASSIIGEYYIPYTPAVAGSFYFKFKTASTSVASKQLMTCLVVGLEWVETIPTIDTNVETLLTNLATVDMNVSDIETALGSLAIDLTPVTDALIIIDDKIDIIDANVDALGTGTGSLAITCQLYQLATTTPIIGVDISVYTAGNDIAAQGTTDSNGRLIVALDAGTYAVRLFRLGFMFAVEPLTVTTSTTEIFYGSALTITAPAEANVCRVAIWCYNIAGTAPLTDCEANAQILTTPYEVNGRYHSGDVVAGTLTAPDLNGDRYWYWDIVQGAEVAIIVDQVKVVVSDTVPSTATALVTNGTITGLP